MANKNNIIAVGAFYFLSQIFSQEGLRPIVKYTIGMRLNYATVCMVRVNFLFAHLKTVFKIYCELPILAALFLFICSKINHGLYTVNLAQALHGPLYFLSNT
jgi:hypothetical protein